MSAHNADPVRRSVTPWTPEEIASLNEYQRSGVFHPFTCPNDHGKETLLVAEDTGWWCSEHPSCGYHQEWAWPWMADGAWRELFPHHIDDGSGARHAD